MSLIGYLIPGYGEIKILKKLTGDEGEDEEDSEESGGSGFLSSLIPNRGKTFKARGNIEGDEIKLKYLPDEGAVKDLTGDGGGAQNYTIKGSGGEKLGLHPTKTADVYSLSANEEKSVRQFLGLGEKKEDRNNGKPKMADGGRRNAGDESNDSSLTRRRDLSRRDNDGGSGLGNISLGKKGLILLALLAGSISGFFLGGPIVAAAIASVIIASYLMIRYLGPGKFLLYGFGVLLVLFLIVGASSTVLAGTGYGLLIQDAIGGQTDGVAGVVNEASYRFGRAWSLMTCFGDAGCVREARLNSTRDVGAESVGETYRVFMDGPEVTGANDISIRREEDPIPIYFRLENARNGVRGIDAKNVSYRVRVRNPRIFGSGTTVCRTDWQPISKFSEETLQEIDPDSLDRVDTLEEFNKMLLPGQAVEPLNEGLDLYECGLMNPAAGTSFKADVQIKYDYSTFSILEVEAMAEDHHQGSKEDANSKAVDTPAKTSILGRDPMTFDTVGGSSVSRPMRLRVWVGTEDRDVDFRVEEESFWIRDSELTEPGESCQGLENVGEDKFELSDDIKKQINLKQENQDEWFTSRSGTPSASCQFKLSEPESVSETGETVTFTSRANYTVRHSEESEGFRVENSRCTFVNCPLLVPFSSSELESNFVNELDLDENNPMDFETPRVDAWELSDYWTKEYALCNRPIDSESSCSWVESFELEDRNNPQGEIDLGEFAVRMDGEPDGTNFFTCYAEDKKSEWSGDVTGVEPEDLEDAFNGDETAFNYTSGAGFELADGAEPSC